MDCSPPGFSVHGILQAKTLEWVAVPSSRGSDSGIEPTSPALWVDSLLLSHWGSPSVSYRKLTLIPHILTPKFSWLFKEMYNWFIWIWIQLRSTVYICLLCFWYSFHLEWYCPVLPFASFFKGCLLKGHLSCGTHHALNFADCFLMVSFNTSCCYPYFLQTSS